jgi:hypothetical protein
MRSAAQRLHAVGWGEAPFPSDLALIPSIQPLASHLRSLVALGCRLSCSRRASKNQNIFMPVIAKFGGIVIRLLVDRTFGTHIHVFYGDFELVIGLNPMRVIQGEAPAWVRDWALHWVTHHQREVLSAQKVDVNLATPISRQMAGHLALAD